MARPTEYNQDILDKAKSYFEMARTIEDDEILPSIEGLALFIDIARSTIYKWKDEVGKEEFSDIIERILEKQGKYLINNGLNGKYNPTITKVILTKHGYIDKQDVTSDGKAIKGNSIVFGNFKNEADSE